MAVICVLAPLGPSTHLSVVLVAFAAQSEHPKLETIMEKQPIRIELTEEQKKQVREATGKDATAIQLTAEELEERVSPRLRSR